MSKTPTEGPGSMTNKQARLVASERIRVNCLRGRGHG